MRFGGDEFIVLGLENVADGRHLEFEQEFQNHIRQVNESQKREYPVSASIGSYTIDDVEHTNLQIVIERADMEMYLRIKTGITHHRPIRFMRHTRCKCRQDCRCRCRGII